MKNVFILAACFLLCSSAFAQGGSAAGIYLGANFPNMNIQSPELTTDNKAGYQIGVFYRKGEVLYGQIGVEYQRMKGDFHFVDSASVTRSDEVVLKTLNAPLYIGANLLPMTDNIVNVRIYGGPTFSLLVDVPLNDVELVASDFRQVRINGGLGAGLDIMLFSLDVGYNFGVSELFSDEFDGKTNYATVNVGIHF
ncbi:MAG: outer membrane beta-barrel protein [Chitinophagales bacterium]